MWDKSKVFSNHWRARSALAALSFAAVLGASQDARAFCGFYVAGADSSLYSNATMVVLMRDGTRTVLSLQNNYQGPPEGFALVVPVPTVLQEGQVKTLGRDVFRHVDALGAPRLVEYWEVDPCRPNVYDGVPSPSAGSGGATSVNVEGGTVTIEAQFAVGEYNVVILGADDSSALNAWLIDNQYNIPAGADAVLAPYVAAGTKFFVAKVDPAKVTFQDGQAALSPLRFYYDTPDFSLPVRLGLLNSQGSQDLIVNILAPSRYEVANYPNVTIPTNIRVHDEVRNGFASFYEALFSEVGDHDPGAVVTEYSWAASTCDPCPTQPLSQADLATLGADVTHGLGSTDPSIPANNAFVNYTLTRLHYRYTKDSLGEDLVFREAPAIVGGRGLPNTRGELEQTVSTSRGNFNNFQGRYVILHPWADAISCTDPLRGMWGGPNGSMTPTSQGATNTAILGMPPMAGDLPGLVAESIPALGVFASNPVDPLAGGVASTSGGSSSTGGSSPTGGKGGTGGNPVAGGSSGTSAGGNAAGGAVVAGGGRSGLSCSFARREGGLARALSASLLALVGLGLRRRRRPRGPSSGKPRLD